MQTKREYRAHLWAAAQHAQAHVLLERIRQEQQREHVTPYGRAVDRLLDSIPSTNRG